MFERQWFGRLTTRDIALSLAAALLLFLSFPKFGQGVFAWIAFVPLLFALRNKDVSQGLMLGLLTGFFSQIGIMYWITYVIVQYGYLPFSLGLCAMLLLAFYLGLYVALFGAGVSYFSQRGVSTLISAPVLWTVLEYGKSHLFTGFPWENLAYSQYLYTPIIQIADLTGLYGITFLIVWINVIFYDLLSVRVQARRRTLRLVFGMAAMSAVCLYGTARVHQVNSLTAQAPSLNVSMIQGDIDQSVKWDPLYQRSTVGTYVSLSLQASPVPPGLIVWPETAMPFYFQDIDQRHRDVVQVARKTGNWLLFGGPGYRIGAGGLISYSNSAFLLSPAGELAGRYDKVHLVPYGEYVPLRKLFPFISKLAVGVGDFQVGEGFFPVPLMGGRKIGILICYEGIFPESARAYRNRGANLLVNITNDAWFGKTSAPYQHLSMTVFRAVENRLFLVRAANTGISAIVDPAGRIAKHTNLFERTTLSGQVKFLDEKTCYTLYGDIFVYACIISLPIIFLLSKRRQ